MKNEGEKEDHFRLPPSKYFSFGGGRQDQKGEKLANQFEMKSFLVFFNERHIFNKSIVNF